MSWVKRILFWKREKIAEELAVEAQFKAQLREAFLRQDDLKEAVNKMRKAREKPFRTTLHSRPTG